MPIHVKYEHSTELAYDFALHYWKSRKLLRIGLWIMVALILIQIAQTLLVQPLDTSRVMSTIIPLLLIIVIWRWLIPYSMKWQLNRASKSSKIGNARELTFQNDGIVIKTGQSEATFNYEGIWQVGASEKSYFLYIAANQALIVPKDAIPAGQEESLLDLLAEKEIPWQGE
ncbi:MAG: YcxB family protein [Bacteroidota bacterium]